MGIVFSSNEALGHNLQPLLNSNMYLILSSCNDAAKFSPGQKSYYFGLSVKYLGLIRIESKLNCSEYFNICELFSLNI